MILVENAADIEEEILLKVKNVVRVVIKAFYSDIYYVVMEALMEARYFM